MDSFHSNQQKKDTNTLNLGPFEIHSFFQPLGDRGGDSFSLSYREGNLYFYIADATGHGGRGAAFWDRQGQSFDCLWEGWISSAPDSQGLYHFIFHLNHILESSLNHDDQPCLAAGVWKNTGEVLWVNCGYGTHILATTKEGPYWKSPEEMFGLKLGWIPPSLWQENPRAYIENQATSVERILLMSDGFLGDDFADLSKTLTQIQQIHQHTDALPPSDIIPYFLKNFSCNGDDATLIIIEREKP